MKTTHAFMLLAMLASASLVSADAVVDDKAADTIYIGGDIITVDDKHPTAEAVAVKDGRILAVGGRSVIEKEHQGKATRVVDLAGKTLLPGFIDAHSHIAGYEMFWGTPDLSPPPVSDVTSIARIQAKMRAFIAEKKIPEGTMVFASGYDDGLIAEKRHPTRRELDEISTAHPVVVMHASQHMLTANSAALKLFGYDRNTPDPEGGVIRRDATGELNGLIEELAMMPLMKFLPKRSLDEKVKVFGDIQRFYASYGITTAQDGMTMPDQFELLREGAKRGHSMIPAIWALLPTLEVVYFSSYNFGFAIKFERVFKTSDSSIILFSCAKYNQLDCRNHGMTPF